MTLEFRILGELQVLRHAALVALGGPRQRAVLAALLVRANRVVSADQLIDDVWAGRPPARAKATLHAYVSKLRRVLEPADASGGGHRVLLSQPPGYLLRLSPDQVDAFRFEALADAGRAALAADEPGRAAELLGTALSLWRGPALVDFAPEPFAAPYATRLEEMRLAVMEDHNEAALALGRHRSLLAELEELIRAHPLRERLREQFILALYRSGWRAEALRAFDDARTALGEGLGIEPGPGLRGLGRSVTEQDPGLDWRPSQAPVLAPTAGEAGVPFVGRAEELGLLHRRLGEALAGQGRLVLVTGDAGIGKTRLLEEVAATARAAGVEVVSGRGSEGEGAPAFSPWTEVLRTLASRLSPDELRSALPSGAGEITRMVPEFGELMPEAHRSTTRRADTARFRLYDATMRFLTGLAARQPLALLFDDIHLADVASLELLGFLAPHLPTAPILLVATYRDTDVHPAHPLVNVLAKLGYEPAVSRLGLHGLGVADVARFVAQCSGVEPSPALVAALHQRTDGNPLFLGELVRLLQAENRLSPSGALAAALPDEIRAVIARRLTALPKPTLRLLEVAAVAGPEFDLEVLGSAAHLAPDQALERLEAAFLSRVLAEDPALPGRYRFTHGLVQEVLYTGLRRRRRIELHHRVGQALEGIQGMADGPQLVALAHHFFRAAPLAPSDSAVAYAERAARWALSHLAYEQAREELERALQLLERQPASLERIERELEIQLLLATLAQTTEGYASPATRDSYARALELCHELRRAPELRPTRELAVGLLQLSSFFLVRGDFPASQDLAEEMATIGRRSGDPLFSWGGHLTQGVIACETGRLPDARAHLERALELHKEFDPGNGIPLLIQHPGVTSRAYLALPRWLLDEPGARKLTIEAVDLARQLNDDGSLGLALFCAALIAVLDGDAPGARRWTEEGTVLCSQRGFRLLAPGMKILRGWARSEQGDPEGAAEAAKAVAAFDATGARLYRSMLLGVLAQTQARTGRIDEALELLEEALAWVADSGERFYEAELHRLRGQFLLAGSPPRVEEAAAAFALGLAVAESQGATALAARLRAAEGLTAGSASPPLSAPDPERDPAASRRRRRSGDPPGKR